MAVEHHPDAALETDGTNPVHEQHHEDDGDTDEENQGEVLGDEGLRAVRELAEAARPVLLPALSSLPAGSDAAAASRSAWDLKMFSMSRSLGLLGFSLIIRFIPR